MYSYARSAGIEPATFRVTDGCSTIELRTLLCGPGENRTRVHLGYLSVSRRHIRLTTGGNSRGINLCMYKCSYVALILTEQPRGAGVRRTDVGRTRLP